MGTPPMMALQVKTPAEQGFDPASLMLKMQQIQALIQGRQLSQAELQGKNLENQKSQMQIDAERNVLAAQQDPHWDPTDPDKAIQVLTHYKVPFSVQQNVIAGLKGYRDLAASSSKENLQAVSDFHSFMDDQYQAAKSANPGDRQSVYEQGLTNVKNYILQLPNGPGKAQAMQEFQKVPSLYDANYVNNQHALLRTQKYLNDEALTQAQAYETGQKGVNEAGKRDQTSPLFAPTPQAVALGTRQENPAMQDVAAGQAEQAGNVAGAEAGAKLPYEIQARSAAAEAQVAAQAKMYAGNSALAKVPPHLVAPATADATKAASEYADAVGAADDMRTFTALARQGNKVAYTYSPTEGVLTLNTARGVKRVNMPEIQSYGGAGSAYDRVTAFLGKQLSGASVPADILDDMDSLHGAVTANAQTKYKNKLAGINQNYGSAFTPVQMQSGAKGNRPPLSSYEK